jgi:tetratricopeptide (TPR) repeat protein
MQRPFVEGVAYIGILVALIAIAAGSENPEPHKHWRLIIVGVLLFLRCVYILVREVPDKPPPPEITKREAIILATGVSAIPFILIVSFVFFGGDKLSRRCSNVKEPVAAIQACHEILRSRRLGTRELSRVFNNIGSAYYQEGQYEMAIANHSHALTLSPDHALRDFDRILSLEPKNTPALSARCAAHILLGQTDPALADCNHALALSPNDVISLRTRGLVYLKTGDYAAALADFEAVIKLDGKQATSLYGRGLIKRIDGDIAGADADIAEAVKIEPHVAEALAPYGLGG